jgi:hypothetical protein
MLTTGQRLLIGCVCTWFLIALPFVTDAACDYPVVLFLGSTGILIALVWFIYTASGQLQPRAWRWWASVPLVQLLVVILFATDLDLALRVALSENQLEESLKTRQNPTSDSSPKRVGLFAVSGKQHYDGGVYFYTSTGFNNHWGVAKIPPGQLPPKVTACRLYGQWYKFKKEF